MADRASCLTSQVPIGRGPKGPHSCEALQLLRNPTRIYEVKHVAVPAAVASRRIKENPAISRGVRLDALVIPRHPASPPA
jgi:hypothetical protein